MKILISMFFLLSSAPVCLWADAHSEALQKLAEIANPPLVITTDTAAGSPSVTVTDKGVLINKAQTPVPYDQLMIGLAALPKSAWPCGRVVFYSTTPLSPAQGAAPSKEVDAKIELELQEANFRLLHYAGR